MAGTRTAASPHLLKNRLVCYSQPNKKWPKIGIVKQIQERRGVWFAEIEIVRWDTDILFKASIYLITFNSPN
jgi:hypothetical protein